MWNRFNKRRSFKAPGFSLGDSADLLAQALHGLRLAAHAERRAVAPGALLQHFAAGEDLAAQVLRRPGKEQFGLDEIAPEERDDRLAQLRDVARAARADHDAAGVPR